MHARLKRHFWVVYVLAIAICAAFAAQAAKHYAAAQDLEVGEKTARAEVRRPATPAEPIRSKESAPLAQRNIFCSTCEPPEPVEAPVTSAPAGSEPPATNLPLQLLATSVAPDPDRSMAFVKNSEAEVSGAFVPGDPLPGAGPLVAVAGEFVDFENRKVGRVERLALGAEGEEAKPKQEKKPRRASRKKPKGKRGELAAEIEAGVKKKGANSYEIEREVVNKVLANPQVLRGARIRPWSKDGKMQGFRVWRVTRNSPLRKVGVKNGDVIQSINGMALTSPDKALEAYTKVRSANSVNVSVLRRGKPITVKFNIR